MELEIYNPPKVHYGGTITPWGQAQRTEVLATGITRIDTSTHGGILVTCDVAKEFLSEAARKLGQDWQGCYAYEEDVLWAVVAWDLPQLWPTMFAHVHDWDEAKIREFLRHRLSGDVPDYLIERGDDLDEEAYQYYLLLQEREQRREAKDPDLIIGASRSWYDFDNERWDNIPGVTEVCTADQRKHLVTADSYHVEENHAGPVLLLSRCDELILGDGEWAAAYPRQAHLIKARLEQLKESANGRA